jgi:hypothetical protein
LKTGHVRTRCAQPVEEIDEPFVDIVDIEGGDFQRDDGNGEGPRLRGWPSYTASGTSATSLIGLAQKDVFDPTALIFHSVLNATLARSAKGVAGARSHLYRTRFHYGGESRK